MRHTPAYANYGRWVADCPQDRCSNALGVEPGQTEFRCGWVADPPVPGCRGVAILDWPDDPAAIEASMAHLPESQQNWQPEPAGATR